MTEPDATTSDAQPPADPSQAPDKRHGDPLLNAAQGAGEVDGSRHGVPPREPDERAARE